MKTRAIIIAVLLLAVVAGAAVAQSVTYMVNLTRGETAYVTCDGAQRLRAERQTDLIVLLTCGRVEQAQPTATPAATPTAQPPGDMTDMTWHAPGAHGDRSYTVLCLRQYVAPTVQPMVFPGNSAQRTFPGEGVVLPN